MAPNFIARYPNIRSLLSLTVLIVIWGSIATDSYICNHLFLNSKSLEKTPFNKLSCLFVHMTRVIDSHVHVWNDGAVPFSYHGNPFIYHRFLCIYIYLDATKLCEIKKWLLTSEYRS